MAALAELLGLIERFEQQLDSYKSGAYNEAQLRIEFLDPFFKLLGWDMDNTAGYAEAYKDVIHEDAIRVGDQSKAPDYCFRIGGTRKFFLEAKKPSVFIKEEIPPAYQLRSYAWSAKLPLSILSDFEEFAFYDCRVKPKNDDSAAVARIFYCTFRDYAEKWNEIAGIFSREAILKGSFDRFVESTKAKKGTAEFDQDFLATIEGWRKELAQNLALRNPKLTQRELNFAVQRIIDRIIFLRICEARAIEDYGRLRSLVNGDCIYPRLAKLFEDADTRYNSGLFHFKKEPGRHESPDELTLELHVDDKLLRNIVRGLYYPESPYHFSVVSADILGQVYEQFLGKVIRLTPGHHAVVEDKPEVKKAGGVYYTPTYIVDYIVQQTVGKLVEGRTPKQVEKLRILDPACGSGSFLIGAYQYLLDWHLQFYTASDPAKFAKGGKPALVQTTGGWKLTIAERKRILLNNIYGVDIDGQAVEVTKLSLLLKVLEGETSQSLQSLFTFFHERALPDLGDNIKCGNSLIGPDFYQQSELPLLTDEEKYRINVFDWEAEFPQILKTGGFEAVIGNPPWGAFLTEPELEYLRRQHREIIVRMIDSFMYFVHQASKKLQPRGFLGMILPDVILYQGDNQKLRAYLLNEFKLHKILNTGDVFHRVTRPACVLVVERSDPAKHVIEVADLSKITKGDKPLELRNKRHFTTLPQLKIRDVPGYLFTTTNVTNYSIWSTVKGIPHTRLGSLVDEDGIQRGVSPDLKEAFLVDSTTANERDLEKHKLRKVLTGGKQVKRFFIHRPDLLLLYTTRGDNFRELPNIRAYIDQFRGRITCKEVKEGKHPLYALHRARDERIFLKHIKLVGVITEDEIVIALDEEQTFATDGLYVFGVLEGINPYYLMGILNSTLFVFVYRLLALESGRVLAQVKPTILTELPIRTINSADKIGKTAHDRIVSFVNSMLELHRKLAIAKTPQEKTALEREIAATDAQIDRLVYDLYGLTEDEIKIVEGTATSQAPPDEPTETLAKPKHGRPAYAAPPPAPTDVSITPEKAYGDAAHYYSGKEDVVPYRTNSTQEKKEES